MFIIRLCNIGNLKKCTKFKEKDILTDDYIIFDLEFVGTSTYNPNTKQC